MDNAWFQRVDLECRARNLSRGERDVLRALGRLMAMGDHQPSEARLASEAGAGRSTVQRAKRRARDLGLLQWDRRFSGAGLRRELPCSYRAELPTQQVVRREHQTRARHQLNSRARSVRVQLQALPAVTPALERLWAMRKERLTSGAGRREAARGSIRELF